MRSPLHYFGYLWTLFAIPLVGIWLIVLPFIILFGIISGKILFALFAMLLLIGLLSAIIFFIYNYKFFHYTKEHHKNIYNFVRKENQRWPEVFPIYSMNYDRKKLIEYLYKNDTMDDSITTRYKRVLKYTQIIFILDGIIFFIVGALLSK